MAAPVDEDALRAAFASSREAASAAARFSAAPDDRTCRYCGTWWRPWAGSKLDGHAKCVVTHEFKIYLGRVTRSPTVTYAAIAKVLGVSIAVVRSWVMPIWP